MSNLEKVALSNQLQWPVLWEADNMENAKICILEFCDFIIGIIL